MSDRSTDPNFVGQVTTVLGETGRPVCLEEITLTLADRYDYDPNETLMQEIRSVVEATILCGRASRIVSSDGDKYTFF